MTTHQAESSLEDRLRTELAPQLEIVRALGVASPPTVFLAREPALRRLVAIKVIDPESATDPKARLRFEREAQWAARIAHPNVVAVYRVGVLSDNLPYIVLQYVEGRSFEDRLEAEGPLSEEEVRHALAAVASALAAAHRRGVVHRDVRPRHVLLEEETGRVFLTDFGSAVPLITGDGSLSRLTTRNRVFGDPRYRSPEQLRQEEVTGLADVYGLGLLGYELLTGESPYEASTPTRWLTAHLHTEPRPLSSLRPGVKPDTEDLLLRCLNKVPEHRPSAAAVARLLTSSASLPSDEPTPGSPAPAGTPPDEADTKAGPETSDTLELVPRVDPLPPPPANVIVLRVLGLLEVLAPDQRRLLSVSSQPKRVALLTYLAVSDHGSFKRRDRLLGVFWPEVEEERARHALRQALYVLRQAMGSEVIESRGNEELRLASDRLWCDVTAFERAVADGDHREALGWYAGELLPGFHLEGAREFAHWLDTERTRLERAASDSAWSLVEQEESLGNRVGAAQWAHKAVELAPWDEASWFRLIELLDRSGDRAGALHAYGRLSRQLASEYEAEPAPETQALARRLRAR